jgi:hypothetical protein
MRLGHDPDARRQHILHSSAAILRSGGGTASDGPFEGRGHGAEGNAQGDALQFAGGISAAQSLSVLVVMAAVTLLAL